MKKVLLALAITSILSVSLPSCSTAVVPVAATSNPVGNKCGKAKYSRILFFFGGKADGGINKAAKTGGITHISHVDRVVKSYVFGLYTVYTTNVYGE